MLIRLHFCHWTRAGACLALACLAFTFPFPANAEQPVRLQWRTSPNASSCPTESEIVARVVSRLGPDTIAQQADRLLHSEVSRSGTAWHATIRDFDAHGRLVGTRQLDARAPDCGAIADAVTLGLVLAIHPQAAFDPPSAPPAPPVAIPPAEQLPPSSAPAPAAVACLAPPPARHVLRTCPQCPRAETARVDLSLRALVVSGVLPSTAAGVAVSGIGDLGDGWKLQLGMRWLPEVRSHAGIVGFANTSGLLGGCRRLHHSDATELDACGHVEVGATHATVYSLVPLHPGDYFWGALGLGPRLSVKLARSARADFGAEAAIPFYRPRFAIKNESEPVFQAPLVGLRGFVGLAMQIP